MKVKDAVVVTGGFGTRISSIFDGPKSLLPVGNTTLIQDQLGKLAKMGVEKVFLLLGNKGEDIETFVAGLMTDLEVEYIYESEPLGTGGALINAKEHLPEVFFFIYGDIFFDAELTRLSKEIEEYPKAEGAFFFHPSSHPKDSDLIVLNEQNVGVELLGKGSYGPTTRNLCLCGVYLLKRDFLKDENKVEGKKIDFEKDILSKKLRNEILIGVRNPGTIRDIGTPERFLDFANKIEGEETKRKGAIFLDRDGVLNSDLGHISKLDDFQLLPNALKAVARLKQMGWKVIVVTNQPAIARGSLTVSTLNLIHAQLEYGLAELGTFFDAIYYCPHHPDTGFEGEVLELKFDCSCRKPKTGLFERAVAEFDIDLKESWMVGDSWRDMEAGQRLGMKTALIDSSQDNHELDANERFLTLLDFSIFLGNVNSEV